MGNIIFGNILSRAHISNRPMRNEPRI